mgnify:CR=1 FL=1
MKHEVPEDLLMAYSTFSKIVFKSLDYSRTKLPTTSASMREYVNEKLSVLSDEQFEKLLDAFSTIRETVNTLQNFER